MERLVINGGNLLKGSVDINGAKKPNIIGKDIFVAVYSREKGFVPAFNNRNSSQIKNDCSKSGRGVSCIMNYLKQ